MVFNNLYRTNLLFLTNLFMPLFKIFQSNHNLAVLPASYFLIYAFFSAAVLSCTLKKNRFAVYRFAPLSFSIYSCFLYADNSHTAGFGLLPCIFNAAAFEIVFNTPYNAAVRYYEYFPAVVFFKNIRQRLNDSVLQIIELNGLVSGFE